MSNDRSIRKRAESATPPRTVAWRVERLRTYYAEHQTIPSYGALTVLWQYSSKSSASALVARLKRDGVLAESPGRRLRPGAHFDGAANPNVSPLVRREAADAIDAAATRWALDVPDEVADSYGLTVRLLAVADLIGQKARREPRSLGLSLGEVLVLDALRRLGAPYESSPAELKNLFLISFAGIGKRLDHLEHLGYIARRINVSDRRGQLVQLTGAGLRLIRDGFKKHYADHVVALLSLPQHERRQLSKTLRHLQQFLTEKNLPLARRNFTR